MALMRMMASPLAEVRQYGEMMLTELRKVIPAFMTRVDVPERGVRWSRVSVSVRDRACRSSGRRHPDHSRATPRSDPRRVRSRRQNSNWLALPCTPCPNSPTTSSSKLPVGMSAAERAEIIAAYVGDRANRRHKPGRAMERTSYRFDVLSDYGAFRDLQRHRMLTLEWQRLTTRHGYDTPPELIGSDLEPVWHEAMSSKRRALRGASGRRWAPTSPNTSSRSPTTSGT